MGKKICYKCNQKSYDKNFICPIGKVCHMCGSAKVITEQTTIEFE